MPNFVKYILKQLVYSASLKINKKYIFSWLNKLTKKANRQLIENFTKHIRKQLAYSTNLKAN